MSAAENRAALRVVPTFERMRDDPQFHALVERARQNLRLAPPEACAAKN